MDSNFYFCPTCRHHVSVESAIFCEGDEKPRCPNCQLPLIIKRDLDLEVEADAEALRKLMKRDDVHGVSKERGSRLISLLSESIGMSIESVFVVGIGENEKPFALCLGELSMNDVMKIADVAKDSMSAALKLTLKKIKKGRFE